MVGDVSPRGKHEIHWNHAPERSGTHSTRRNILLSLPENRFTRAAAVTRANNNSVNAGKAQVDPVLRLSFEFQMNPSPDMVARRERKCIEFEIGIAEAAVTNRRADRIHQEDDANQAKAEKYECTRIGGARHLRDKSNNHRKQNQIAENADYPVGDFALFV